MSRPGFERYTPQMTALPSPDDAAPRGLPLARKLPLLILGLLAIALAVSLGVSYYAIRRSAERAVADRLESLSQVLASLLDQQLSARLTLMERVARDSVVQAALATPDRAPSAAVTRALAALTLRNDSSPPPELWTASGRKIGEVALDLPGDSSRLRELQRARSADSGHVGPLTLAGRHGTFWLVADVRRDGKTIGYVAQERVISNNAQAVQSFKNLVGHDITLYYRNAADDTWLGFNGAPAARPTDSTRFGGTLQFFTMPGPGQVLASTRPLGHLPWLISVAYPVAGYLAPSRATMRMLLVIAILLVVAGALAAWIIGRRVVRPLVGLTDAAEALARGDYTHRVRASGGDEVGRLAASFNRMADQVHDASMASTNALARLTTSEQRQRFLADASSVLAASISDETLLPNIVRFCVPSLADYCSIYAVDGEGALRRIETAHHDRAAEVRVRDLVRRYEYRLDGAGEVADVIRSQRPLLIPRIDVDEVARHAPDADTGALVRAVGPSSFLCVPLVARGRAIGALSFTMTDSGRVFESSDLALATEIAHRVAVAMDNATLYRRSVALRLEAEGANHAKSEFLAKMSHEIRTPINAMLGYAELLEMGIAGPISETQAKHLSRIRASGAHLTSLVDEILDLAKIEAGRMAITATTAAAHETAEAALTLTRPQAAHKRIDLIVPAADASVQYFGDPQRVQQILTNLLSNAVKFTPAGGSVTVRCSLARRDGDAVEESPWACIAVEDTGIGIAEPDIARIFDPFVQVETGYTRAHGGSGLGLAISRNLAQMMGGDITVRSTVGQGSCFTVWLPAAHPSAVARFMHSAAS